MVAATTVTPLLVAGKDGIVAVEPLAARPIDGVSFVQVKVVPGVALNKSIAAVVAPLQ